MKWWLAFKANPLLYLLIGAGALVVIIALVSMTGRLVNSYKESQFQKRQAEYLRQMNEAIQKANTAQAEADKAKAEGKQKDAQVADLQNQIESLRAEVGQKRIIYVNSRKPVTLRPVGSGVSDAELRADAKRLGIVIR